MMPYTGAPAQRVSDDKVSHESKVAADEIEHHNHSVPDQQRVPMCLVA